MAPLVAVVGLLEVFSAIEELRSVLVPLRDADTYERRSGLYSRLWRFMVPFFFFLDGARLHRHCCQRDTRGGTSSCGH